MAWLTAIADKFQTFNTHVANATGQVIYARIEPRSNATESSFNLNVTGSAAGGASGGGGLGTTTKRDWISLGFMKIGVRDKYAFQDTGSEPVLSAVTAGGEVICDRVGLRADHSVIVTMNGIKNTQYGKIWVDSDGHSY